MGLRLVYKLKVDDKQQRYIEETNQEARTQLPHKWQISRDRQKNGNKNFISGKFISFTSICIKLYNLIHVIYYIIYNYYI